MQRRGFLAGLAATPLASAAWADAGSPRLISAATDAAKRSWLVGLSGEGRELFRLPIPGRGHAAAAHPTRPLAVAFARRPGRFAVVLDCANGSQLARLNAPEGRHFYGHGAFSADGNTLLTTENAVDSGEGRIGIWDVQGGFRRAGDLPSGGIGPHELLRLPGGGFAVANGGILTHPDYGRAKLNLPDMRPNLAYLNAQGGLKDVIEPPGELRQNSIRHIDADASGRVAVALQWQGDPRADVPLAALHVPCHGLTFLDHPQTARMKHYAGSVAFSRDGARIAVSAPKGGHLIQFDGASGTPRAGMPLALASGVAALGKGVAVTFAGGVAFLKDNHMQTVSTTGDLVWDNHLVAL